MHGEMGEMVGERLAFARRPRAPTVSIGEHDVAERFAAPAGLRWPRRRKRQHVGRLVDAAPLRLSRRIAASSVSSTASSASAMFAPAAIAAVA